MSLIWMQLKPFIGQALGVFTFMLSEAVLGKSRFGSWLGLAKAAVWFIVGAIFGGATKVFQAPNNLKGERQMSGKVGIVSLVAMVSLGLDVIMLGEAVAKDGVSMMDLGLIMQSAPKLIQEGSEAFAGAPDVLPELKDLQIDEAEQLLALVEAKLGLDDKAKATVVADKAIKAGFAVYDLVQAVSA